LFEELFFEVVIKHGRLNAGTDHLSRQKTRENEGAVVDQLLNANLFRIQAIRDHLEEIATLLLTGQCPEGYTVA